jgi:hypothetical protein
MVVVRRIHPLFPQHRLHECLVDHRKVIERVVREGKFDIHLMLVSSNRTR